MATEIIYLIKRFKDDYENKYEHYKDVFEEKFYEIQNSFIYYLSKKIINNNEEIVELSNEIYNLFNKYHFPRNIGY